ncbi:MAG: ankyrin repeat domain-containing protein [Micavibrio sp.]|nr:ankyrin repeat domain-containing protein [Micavibrio sp.]
MTDFKPDHDDLLWRDFMKTQPDVILADAAFQAAHDGNLWQVEALLDMGVDVDSESAEMPGRANMSLLHIAVQKSRHDVARFLLSKGADANLPDENVELTLIKAVNNNDPEMLQLLMAAKADPRQTNEFGDSAIDLAQGHPQLLAVLEPQATARHMPAPGRAPQNKGL